MNTYWPAPGFVDDDEVRNNRRNLVAVLNFFIEEKDNIDVDTQQAFIYGAMSNYEAALFIRFAECTIAENKGKVQGQ